MRRLFAVFAMQIGGVAVGFALGWALGVFTLPANSADNLGQEIAVGVRGVDQSADSADRSDFGDPAGDDVRANGRTIEGTDGDDELSPGPGPSTVELGPGNDTVNLAVDGARDVVLCGHGNDLVVQLGAVDPKDEFHDCEQFAELIASP